MNIKRIIAIVFSCGLIVSTCAVSVAAYDHTFRSGYDFTVYGKVNNSEVFDMRCYHKLGKIYTKGINKAGISTYMSLGATVYNKSTGGYITDRSYNGVCAKSDDKQVACTDYRSTNPYVYYMHDCTIYGDTSGQNQASKIATRATTVG